MVEAAFIVMGFLGWFLLWSQIPDGKFGRRFWIVSLGGFLLYFSGVLAGMAGK